MLIKTKVDIDLQRPAYPATVNAVQGDRNTRCIEAALYSGGAAWQVPEDVTVSMRYRKPDRTGGYYDAMPDGSPAWSIQDNTVTMLLAPQMLTAAGTVFAQLEMLQGSNVLGTFTMYVRVEEDPSVGMLQSEDYINWLQWMEKELDDRLKDAAQSGVFNGPAGEPGEAAVLLSAVVMYQIEESGSQIPSGQWQLEIPDTEQGNYLWTRTVYTFNTGDPVTQYAVSRLKGDTAGVQKVAAVLLTSGWSDALPYTQTVTIDTLSDDKNARAYPEAPTGTLEEKLALAAEISKVRWCVRSGTDMTFECPEEKPDLDIPVVVEVYA